MARNYDVVIMRRDREDIRLLLRLRSLGFLWRS